MLDYYVKERFKYSHEYNLSINREEVNKIFKKLTRHFKITNIYKLKFLNNKNASCNWWRCNLPLCWLELPKKDFSLGLLVHEIAHGWQHLREGDSGHNRRHDKLMGRLFNYCKKMEYWGLGRPIKQDFVEIKQPEITKEIIIENKTIPSIQKTEQECLT